MQVTATSAFNLEGKCQTALPGLFFNNINGNSVELPYQGDLGQLSLHNPRDHYWIQNTNRKCIMTT